jgi:hypothetical protein
MTVQLRLRKNGKPIYEGLHDIRDAESFGAAFAAAWLAVQAQRLMATTSVGQLMEEINDDVLDDLNGAQIALVKIEAGKK